MLRSAPATARRLGAAFFIILALFGAALIVTLQTLDRLETAEREVARLIVSEAAGEVHARERKHPLAVLRLVKRVETVEQKSRGIGLFVLQRGRHARASRLSTSHRPPCTTITRAACVVAIVSTRFFESAFESPTIHAMWIRPSTGVGSTAPSPIICSEFSRVSGAATHGVSPGRSSATPDG